MKWKTQDGTDKEISEVDDIHLANIHYHVHYYKYFKNTRAQIDKEVKKRNFNPNFLSNAPYPYVDARDGVTKIWDFTKRYSVPVRKPAKDKPQKHVWVIKDSDNLQFIKKLTSL